MLQRPLHGRLSTTSAAERANRRHVPVPRPAPNRHRSVSTRRLPFAALRFRPRHVNRRVRPTVQRRNATYSRRTRLAGRNDRRWLSVEARDAKRSCRRLERRYRRTLTANFQAARAAARKAVAQSRSDAITNWAFTRYDRRTDRSVRPRLRPTVCQTSRTDLSDRL